MGLQHQSFRHSEWPLSSHGVSNHVLVKGTLSLDQSVRVKLAFVLNYSISSI